ncbi:MAG: hypothetical protein Q4F84_09720, partial [Fibrobacter sp.]|nr:hypothetical protein [Fibrobacter sp.]
YYIQTIINNRSIRYQFVPYNVLFPGNENIRNSNRKSFVLNIPNLSFLTFSIRRSIQYVDYRTFRKTVKKPGGLFCGVFLF